MPLEPVVYDIRGGDDLATDFRQLNPFGRVPILELDDGTFLAESVAMCRYLEGLHPEPSLFGTTLLEMAQIEIWSRRAEMNFIAPGAAAFRNITGIFKDREKVLPEWGEICADVAASALQVFNNELASRKFLAGDNFSITDITLAVALGFTEKVQFKLPFDFPNTVRYRADVAARPGFS